MVLDRLVGVFVPELPVHHSWLVLDAVFESKRRFPAHGLVGAVGSEMLGQKYYLFRCSDSTVSLPSLPTSADGPAHEHPMRLVDSPAVVYLSNIPVDTVWARPNRHTCT
jgi:hypothetical protein